MEKYNFIENKWYSFNWDYSGKDCMVIAKIERVTPDFISISWRKYLWDNTISIQDGYEYVDISNIKELSLCDIQQYLPEDHPEKIKVGSYLIRPDAAAPKALKITKITRGGYHTDPPMHFVPHPLLRFATEEEINKAENKLENSKEEFVLPEKWCINKLANPEIIGEWFNKNSDVPAEHRSFVDYCTDLNHSPYLHYPKCFSGSCVSAAAQKGYTEITFEQFKKYVMKEENEIKPTKQEELPFKIGDKFRIKAKPSTWSSSAGSNAKYPLDNSFPYEGVVKKIVKAEEDHIAILDENDYGWNYYSSLFVKVEEEPKEDTKSIPKYWYIENKYQEVRDYLADAYNEPFIKNWIDCIYIGFDGSNNHSGCQGFGCSMLAENNAIKITIEQFREYFLNKPKEVKQDDYSWWNGLEAGDVIESLIDLKPHRSKGEQFTVLKIVNGKVFYKDFSASAKKEEWKLISKAKDKKVEMKPDYSNCPKVSFEELQIGSKFVNIKYNTDIRTVTAKNVDAIYYSDSDGKNQELHKEYWYILDCRLISHPTSEYKVIPEPEVLEMVPIDKYFKIRN